MSEPMSGVDQSGQPDEETLAFEQLRPEDQAVITKIRDFNNLNPSIAAAEHYMMPTFREAAVMMDDDQETKDVADLHERLSNDIRWGMTEVDLSREEGDRYINIRHKQTYTKSDLEFLRQYAVKIGQLYQLLRGKGWKASVIGVVNMD